MPKASKCIEQEGCNRRHGRNNSTTSTVTAVAPAIPFEIVTPLTDDERTELVQCEEQIRRSFTSICTALLTIHDKRLYRENFGTFEDYADKTLGWSRSYAHRYVEAGRVLQLLLPIGNIELPKLWGGVAAMLTVTSKRDACCSFCCQLATLSCLNVKARFGR
jgi:hypothetical protein